MATRNNCNINSVSPLEVNCVVTNATAPNTQDGSILLQIFGGTGPYSTTWTNGASGNQIYDLQAGCYTATTTDYYGDYSVTTVCCVENDTFYIDELLKCADNFDGNIFVFYDGTSMGYEKSLTASQSIRNWYQGKKSVGYGGNLYEGVIGHVASTANSLIGNGENWLWWATYPYLGSLTGGTLTGGTLIEYYGANGESVSNAESNSLWCQNSTGDCIPNPPSFNFSNNVANSGTYINSDVYKRINNGFKLTGPYGIPDDNSSGVPFTVTPSMDGEYSTVFGDFIGKQKNYICIILADEADDTVGLYHGKLNRFNGEPNNNFLYTNPFELFGGYWDNNSLREYSDRYEHDYESFLKVWEEIKDSSGTFNGFLYPVTEESVSRPPFIQHGVAAVEGTTITSSEFNTKYESDISDVGPLNLNLSALTRTNVYSGLTGTTAYMNLDTDYKNGPGLKNFDWKVDPTVDSFEEGVIGDTLDEFLESIQYTDEYIYSSDLDAFPPLVSGTHEDNVYQFAEVEGCYSYQQRLLRTNQDYYSDLTVTGTFGANNCLLCQPSTEPPPIQPTLCFSNGEVQYQFNPTGMTNDYFVWYHEENSLTLSYNQNNNRWEITPWSNVGLGGMVRQVDEQIPTGSYTNLGVTGPDTWTMTEGFCEGVPVTVTANPSRETCDGQDNGEVILLGNGGTPPYEFRLQNIPPFPSYSPTGIFYNLSPDNYLGEIRDSLGNTSTVNFTIQSGEPQIEYTVSVSTLLTNQSVGSRTYNYGIDINPALAPGVELTFDIKMLHSNIYRSVGTAVFSYEHTITKNGTLNIPYTTSSTSTNSYDTGCSSRPTNEIVETFNNVASDVTFSSTDTSINGTVTQTVQATAGAGVSCEQQCKMKGQYITSIVIQNLSIDGTVCDTVVNANTPAGINNTIFVCSDS